MKEKVLMKGNEALAEGALRAGCRFFAGYPITPQNEIPEYLSAKIYEYGGAFVQAESETSAVNMVFGSASTGVRAMTSSSSPGVSLKQEGISFLAGADLPCLIVNVMRGGPGIGNIIGAQGDYMQATRGGGHGDYRLIVLAPNSVEEMGNFPRLAFELAEKYRMPAMILTDGVIGQMMEGMSFNDDPVDMSERKEPGFALGINTGRETRRVATYNLAEGELEKEVLQRACRYAEVEKNEVRYEEVNTDGADVLMVAYGISSRSCLEAIQLAKEEGLKLGLLRPITLWPFPYEIIGKLAEKSKAVLTVEMSLGQLVTDVKLAVKGSKPVYLHARPAGGIPNGYDILEAAKSALKGGGAGLYDPAKPAMCGGVK
ncbi:2-oxoglutarate ferredoxin oxidoreductase subunit alpha [Parelusimicrobium proximum]|uniref:3-methyl-2-oxobutanoate dehydrogenase subunit VorB n=1 Tax=Parelusimicrobium proximum TaxID=3228953 RepID=UPI003D162F2D